MNTNKNKSVRKYTKSAHWFANQKVLWGKTPASKRTGYVKTQAWYDNQARLYGKPQVQIDQVTSAPQPIKSAVRPSEYTRRTKLVDIITGKSLSTQKFIYKQLKDILSGNKNVKPFYALARKMGVKITKLRIRK